MASGFRLEGSVPGGFDAGPSRDVLPPPFAILHDLELGVDTTTIKEQSTLKAFWTLLAALNPEPRHLNPKHLGSKLRNNKLVSLNPQP